MRGVGPHELTNRRARFEAQYEYLLASKRGSLCRPPMSSSRDRGPERLRERFLQGVKAMEGGHEGL